MMQIYSILIGLVALAIAFWAGIHMQHVLEEATVRHVGETAVAGILALGLFIWSRRGQRSRPQP
jgi:hypothetical protein